MARFSAVSGDVLDRCEVDCIKLIVSLNCLLIVKNEVFVIGNKMNEFFFIFINFQFASFFDYS